MVDARDLHRRGEEGRVLPGPGGRGVPARAGGVGVTDVSFDLFDGTYTCRSSTGTRAPWPTWRSGSALIGAGRRGRSVRKLLTICGMLSEASARGGRGKGDADGHRLPPALRRHAGARSEHEAKAWDAWMHDLGSALKDGGNPFAFGGADQDDLGRRRRPRRRGERDRLLDHHGRLARRRRHEVGVPSSRAARRSRCTRPSRDVGVREVGAQAAPVDDVATSSTAITRASTRGPSARRRSRPEVSSAA